MRIFDATGGDAELLHDVQARSLLADPRISRIVPLEDVASIRHSTRLCVCLIAEHRGVALGAIRAQDRGGLVYIDALWVPRTAKHASLRALLLLALEARFPINRIYQVRAFHGDPQCYRAYGMAGYTLAYEDEREDGLLLRLYEKTT